MRTSSHTCRLAVAGLGLVLSASAVHAQSAFTVGTQEVQVHGSIQQGFVVSDGNNFLTMDTASGSAAMTDGAVNLSTQFGRALRIGAQLYSRNIGELGNGQLQLDWAFADYKFNDAIGIRAGKVKTPLGLFNDTQDMEFLHTWALLPQGVYPLDLRSVTIAHVGADAYGTLKTTSAGSVNYTVYAGSIQDDTRGGYRYGVEDSGMRFDDGITTRGVGFDARWSTPVDGLVAGYSLLRTSSETRVTVPFLGTLDIDIPSWKRQALYGDYQRGRVRLSSEMRLSSQKQEFSPALTPATLQKARSWFASGTVRVHDRVELGTYHSRMVSDMSLPSADADNHIYDTALSGRVDLNRWWHVKVEGHFIDGVGSRTFTQGFYSRNNVAGLQPRTKMLVIRTGINF